MIDNISWLAVYPEIVLLVMACVIALVDLWVKSPRRTATYVLTMLTLAVVAALEGVYACPIDQGQYRAEPRAPIGLAFQGRE